MTTFSPGLGSSSSGGAEVQLKNAVGTVINPATADNQTLELALQTQLQSLTETIQELNARLMVLAGMANSGAPALRVAPISSVSTAVTLASTVVSSLTNFGTGIPASEMAHDMNNMTAVLSNINNVTV